MMPSLRLPKVKSVIVVAAIVPPSTLSPDIWLSASVKVPEDTSKVFPVPTVTSDVAIVTPSIVPPLISVVVSTELASVTTPVESAIEPAEVPSLAFKFVTSRFVVSRVVAFTLVMLPVVEVNVVIVVAAIVPPSTLSPEIWSSAKVRVPDETSKFYQLLLWYLKLLW